MNSFKALQSRHVELINKVQTEQDIVAEVQTFIEDAKASSSQISSAGERDQLRANLRYWASYLYEKTGTYPSVDLAPATFIRGTNLFTPLGLGVALLAVCGLLGAVWFTRNVLFTGTPPPTPTEVRPLIPVTSPSQTPTPISTATPGIEPPEANVISLQLTSLRDGDVVPPRLGLEGTYADLPPRSTIHVLVQPLSQGSTRFPMQQYVTVAPNASTGEWGIEAVFGRGEELREAEDYLISLIVVTDEQVRHDLLAAVETGLQDLPEEGVLRFPQTISVSRAAYAAAIDGERLIYSSYLDAEFNLEIFSASIDGSDNRRITYTSRVFEQFPSLSPDGRKIAYVAQIFEGNRMTYQIEVMNSDGTAPEVLVEPQDQTIYERPLWSDDGTYIVYAAGRTQSSGRTVWSLFLYDFEEQESTEIVEGDTISGRFFSWIPDTHRIVFDGPTRGTTRPEILEMDVLASGEPVPYFEERGFKPLVSPDGTQLAYIQSDEAGTYLSVVDLQTRERRQLAGVNLSAANPAWDSTGTTLFFDSSETPFITIWSVGTDGSPPVQLTFGKDRYPFVGYMYALLPE